MQLAAVEFVNYLSTKGVEPQEQLLYISKYKSKGTQRLRPKKVYSPPGYSIHEYHDVRPAHQSFWGTTLTDMRLLTPDGRLFVFHNKGGDPGAGEYVPISADTLLSGDAALTSHISFDDDGVPFTTDNDDNRVNIQDGLVAVAARLTGP